MATVDFKRVPPAPINEFRGYEDLSDNIEIPELAMNRDMTDVGFLYFFVFTFLATVCAAAIASFGTDYSRFIYGYDECGDTCGVKNEPIKGINCSGKDLTGKPIMKIKYFKVESHSVILPNVCVEKCKPPNKLDFNRCFPKNKERLNEESESFKTSMELIGAIKSSGSCFGIMCSVGLVLTLIVLVLFQYWPKGTLIFILVSQAVVCFGFTAYTWYSYATRPKESETLYLGIIATLTALIMFILVLYFYAKYEVMLVLYQEATMAIFRYPMMLLVPAVILIVMAAIISSTVFLIILISTNQNLVKSKVDPSTYVYVTTPVAFIAFGFFGVLILWLFAFVSGCQTMGIAGAVSYHYFTRPQFRDKFTARWSVCTSCYILLRFHLGTVAFGSFLVAFMVIFKGMIAALEQRFCPKCKFCFKQIRITYLNEIFDCITKRAYIETAIHGSSLCKSGTRATSLLWNSLLENTQLDILAEFILICTLMTITLSIAGIALVIKSNEEFRWLTVLTGAFLTGTVVYFTMHILNVASETICICYCEDKILNDGSAKPYFASSKLQSALNKARNIAISDG